jgi:hypothetical protein
MLKIEREFTAITTKIDNANIKVSDNKKVIALNVGKLMSIFEVWNELEKRYNSIQEFLDDRYGWKKSQRNDYLKVGKFLLDGDNANKYSDYNFTQLVEIAGIKAKDRDAVMAKVTPETSAKAIRALKNEGKPQAPKKASKADVKQALAEMLACDDITTIKNKIKNLMADL